MNADVTSFENQLISLNLHPHNYDDDSIPNRRAEAEALCDMYMAERGYRQTPIKSNDSKTYWNPIIERAIKVSMTDALVSYISEDDTSMFHLTEEVFEDGIFFCLVSTDAINANLTNDAKHLMSLDIYNVIVL
mgnify:CR=1 FL=1